MKSMEVPITDILNQKIKYIDNSFGRPVELVLEVFDIDHIDKIYNTKVISSSDHYFYKIGSGVGIPFDKVTDLNIILKEDIV